MSARAVDAATVEAVVRFVVINGPAPSAMFARLGVGRVGGSDAPRSWFDDARRILAACPFRVAVGRTSITPIEQAVLAEEQLPHAARLVEIHAALDVAAGCARPSFNTLQAMREWLTWERMRDRYRDHVLFAPCVRWLGVEYGRLVYGDPVRGLRGDPSFLGFVEGA